MSDPILEAIRAVIQEDVGNRGLRTDPHVNLITACHDDFRLACHSIAAHDQGRVGVVTGFFIPHADPPAGETDGPLGALFLARALLPLGIRVVLITDAFCTPALTAGLEACGLEKAVDVLTLPPPHDPRWHTTWQHEWQEFQGLAPLTHLIALERVGPSHTLESLRQQPGTTLETVEHFLKEVPAAERDRCHTMGGRDITSHMSPAHLLFELAEKQTPRLTTIGIGDGGNEIGMGKLPWEVIQRNIARGGLVACRVPADYLIVCGISNWGAYGLAAGVHHLRGVADRELFDVERERDLLRVMIERGPLVDGVSGKSAVMVDGLAFERYAEALRRIGEVFA